MFKGGKGERFDGERVPQGFWLPSGRCLWEREPTLGVRGVNPVGCPVAFEHLNGAVETAVLVRMDWNVEMLGELGFDFLSKGIDVLIEKDCLGIGFID